VIVFRRTADIAECGPDELVKRVVGLPGELISVHEGRLAINDQPVPRCDVGVYPHLVGTDTTLGRLVVEWLGAEPYLTFLTPFSRPFVPYRVGPGEVFVLGDNRNNSADSRVWNSGRGAGLPITAIDGRVWRRLATRDRDGRVELGVLLRPLGLGLHLPGMDVRPLQEGLRKCLEAAPTSSAPS
jgi:signal peptidase I